MGIETRETPNSNIYDIHRKEFLEYIEKKKLEAISLKSIYAQKKHMFHTWLDNRNLSDGYRRDCKNNVDKFFQNNITDINSLIKFIETNNSKKYTKLGLRNWIKFLEDKELVSEELTTKLKSKIKVSEKSGIDHYVPSIEDIQHSLFLLKAKSEDYLELYKLLIYSGIRFSELAHVLNTYDPKNLTVDREVLCYSSFYNRGSKNIYYIFLPVVVGKETLERLSKFEGRLEQFKEYCRRKEGIVSLKYLRKFHFTHMIKAGISLEIANFIEGRISGNIGFNHYLAKKEIAIEEYHKFLIYINSERILPKLNT